MLVPHLCMLPHFKSGTASQTQRPRAVGLGLRQLRQCAQNSLALVFGHVAHREGHGSQQIQELLGAPDEDVVEGRRGGCC